MNSSFEEKSAWIQLFSLVAVLGGYFIVAAMLLSKGITTIGVFVPLFIIAVVLLTIVLVVAHIAAAIVVRPDDPDERDRLISWRAESNSGWILGAGVIAAITGLVMSVDTVWIAHLLMLSLLLSEVVKLVLQILYYRRGM